MKRSSSSPHELSDNLSPLGSSDSLVSATGETQAGHVVARENSQHHISGAADSSSPISSSSSKAFGARSARKQSETKLGGGIVGSSNSLSNKVVGLSRASSRELIVREYGFMDHESMQAQVQPVHQHTVHNSPSGKAVTQVLFQVNIPMTNFGDEVVVTGNTKELGFWDPHHGVKLRTDQKTFPLWTVLLDVPSGQNLEYKYVLIRAGGELQWETGIKNRRCTPEGMSISLEDGTFNKERAMLMNKEKKAVTKSKHTWFTEAQVSIEETDCIYILTYRLPIITHYDHTSGKYSFQWLSFVSDTKQRENDNNKVLRSMSRHGVYVIESLRGLRSKCKVVYVGALGFDIPKEHQEQVTEQLSAQFQCIPVFLPTDQAREFEDFCHDTLKPIFHFVHPTSKEVCVSFNNAVEAGVTSKTEGSKWQLYNTVNLAYVQPVVQNCNDGDCVFVFDLELLMAPTLIGSRARTANICFFFNTPFPSAEIFRTIPVRKQILRSLLNADFVQFHCFTYARHFLSCCSTLLGLEYKPTRGGMLHLVFNGHHCHVRASHVGIDADTLDTRLKEDIVLQQQRVWYKKFEELGRQVILVGYDDLEPLAGITLKLQAYKAMLSLFKEYRYTTLLIQVAIPLHDRFGNVLHAEYIEQVRQLREEIDAQFPGCLIMMHEKLPFAPRAALFSASDALVNCAVRHGLSLVPFEYVLASEMGDGKKGSLIISEFAACSRVIPGVMRFSPWKDEDVAKAIVKCLKQPQHSRVHWHTQQMAWCKHNTVLRWAKNILDDMKKVRKTMLEMGEDVKRSASCRVGLVKSTYKEISSNALKQEQVTAAYGVTKSRLLLLDVDLLIRPKEETADSYRVGIVKALEMLVEEPGNYVFLLSNESRENLLKWLKDMKQSGFDKIGLAAEDGYYYKWPGSPIDRWDIRQEVRADWKDMTYSLMHQYATRTTGSFVEDDKVASITWHYGSTHPEFGVMQGKELLNHLKDTMAHLPVEVVMGKSFVRVRNEEVTKGALVKHIVEHYNRRGGVDFILCLGDDRMDERVFTVLRDYQVEAQYRVSGDGTEQEIKVFLCCVGKQPSVAAYCLYSLEDVQELLRCLSVQTKRKLRTAATMLELAGLNAVAKCRTWDLNP